MPTEQRWHESNTLNEILTTESGFQILVTIEYTVVWENNLDDGPSIDTVRINWVEVGQGDCQVSRNALMKAAGKQEITHWEESLRKEAAAKGPQR